jgi:D-sedoheptulose 7-phosphate isomerase
VDAWTGGGVAGVAHSYISKLNALLTAVDTVALERVVEHLRAVRDAGGTVFVAGNGGSAATASHWVNDLGKATKMPGRPHLRVMCLSDNTSWLTALANDEGYERVFAGQLENFAKPGDVLVVISASGKSPNIVSAVELAAASGLTTIGLVGFDGGVVAGMVDEAICIRTELGEYGLVESAHSVVLDVLTTCLARDWAAALLP